MSEDLETMLMRVKPDPGFVRITFSGSLCWVETKEPGRHWTKIVADEDSIEACKRHMAMETWRASPEPDGDPIVNRRKARQDAALLKEWVAA